MDNLVCIKHPNYIPKDQSIPDLDCRQCCKKYVEFIRQRTKRQQQETRLKK